MPAAGLYVGRGGNGRMAVMEGRGIPRGWGRLGHSRCITFMTFLSSLPGAWEGGDVGERETKRRQSRGVRQFRGKKMTFFDPSVDTEIQKGNFFTNL